MQAIGFLSAVALAISALGYLAGYMPDPFGLGIIVGIGAFAVANLLAED